MVSWALEHSRAEDASNSAEYSHPLQASSMPRSPRWPLLGNSSPASTVLYADATQVEAAHLTNILGREDPKVKGLVSHWERWSAALATWTKHAASTLDFANVKSEVRSSLTAQTAQEDTHRRQLRLRW
eukprot:1027153-Amphidinium_carterae.3